MKYRVRHQTIYRYENSVALCHNQAHLLPRHTPRQRCISSHLEISPTPIVASERMDYFGNRSSHFIIQTPHDHLSITAHSELEVQAHEPKVPTYSWEQAVAQFADDRSAEALMARDFCLPSPLIPHLDELLELLQPSFPPQRPLLDAIHDFTHRIYQEFAYDPSATTVVTPLDQVIALGRGVCQDFAHLAIACLRHIGIPARYVSGYLETLPPPGQPKLQGADASHAWFAAYFPGVGWLDFDPTNAKMPDEQYITTAWGRDYSDVPPLKGIVFGGGGQTLTVGVDVERHEAPSASAP